MQVGASSYCKPLVYRSFCLLINCSWCLLLDARTFRTVLHAVRVLQSKPGLS
jgi:hypothetical protein